VRIASIAIFQRSILGTEAEIKRLDERERERERERGSSPSELEKAEKSHKAESFGARSIISTDKNTRSRINGFNTGYFPYPVRVGASRSVTRSVSRIGFAFNSQIVRADNHLACDS